MKSVIELIRVSTEAQARDDRASLPAQRAANRRTAAAYGLEIVRSIEYSDVSGAAVMLAPEMQELIRLIADPTVHGVVAREFSRLMRPENFTDYALLQHFVDTDTILYLPDGPIDFASKTGRILGPLRAALAGVERVEMLEKIWGAKEEKRSAGGFAQSAVCLPYGVGYSKEAGWHYTVGAAKVREAFRLLLAGHSNTELARILGVTLPGVKKILRNPIYTGWRVIDERRDPRASARRTRADGRQGDRPRVKRAPEDVIRVRVIEGGLISGEEFARAQAILDARARMNARTVTADGGRFTYNGFLSCGACGQLVYTHFRRRDYYVCKARKREGACGTVYMRREVLDPKLDEMFADRLSDEGFWRMAATELLRKSGGETTRGTPDLAGEVSRLEARRGRVLEAFFDGAIERDERDERLHKLDGELAAVRSALDGARPAEYPDALDLAEFFEVFDDFASLPRLHKRAILSAAVPEITVANYIVTGLSLVLPRGDNFTHAGRGSSPPRA